MAEQFYAMLSDENNATFFLIIIACYVLILTPIMVFYAIRENSRETVDFTEKAMSKDNTNEEIAKAEKILESDSKTIDDNQTLDNGAEK